AVVGAEEDEFARRALNAGRIEHGLQRDAGPAAVAAQTLERSAVAGAFEAGDELARPHLLELVQRKLAGPTHQSRELEFVRREIDVWMTVVLRRRELVFRRQRTVDRPHVEQPPVGRRFPSDVLGNVSEWH